MIEINNKKKIALIYGSDTGTTEGIAKELEKLLLTYFDIEILDMYKVKIEDFDRYNYFVLGLSTWYDGELQNDWYSFFDQFCEIDFTNKVIAIFGLGDQYGYGEYFVDGVGILATQVEKSGGKIIGKWPTDGYEFDESKALINEKLFYGLAIDEDNQGELTTERIENWVGQLKEEFSSFINT